MQEAVAINMEFSRLVLRMRILSVLATPILLTHLKTHNMMLDLLRYYDSF
jgi:hypothetical protein